MMRHLIHVGFPKTGSTLLQRWFEAHPALGYVPGGVAGFRDVHGIVRDSVSPTRPAWVVTSSERLTAPTRFTDDVGWQADWDGGMGAAQERACDTLSDLFPNAHILIVTRGFRSMLLSSYSQYVRSGGKLTLPALFARDDLLRLFEYDRVVAAYRRRFGAERVIVLPYELLADAPAAFFRTLEERLGIAPFPPGIDRVNSALSGVELAGYPRLHRWLAALPLPARVRRWATGLLARASYGNRLRLPVGLLQRWRPLEPVTLRSVPDTVLDRLRGAADELATEPLHRRYAADYLA